MPETIELTYDPFALPTAQHRAGLAGMLVHLETLEQRHLEPIPQCTLEADGTVTMRLTEDTLSVVFDDLYAGAWELRQMKTRPKEGSTIRNVHEVEAAESSESDQDTEDKPTKSKAFAYETIIPATPFFAALQMPPLWQKLWREALWATLRGVPKTRLPYERRARGEPASDGRDEWTAINRSFAPGRRGGEGQAEVTSALFIGAQAFNAERIPFQGIPEQNLLLHFWPIVMGVGDARRLKLDRGNPREERAGYVLVVPDVADVDMFVHDFRSAAAQLSDQLEGYRPRGSVLALPEEGGLEYLRHLYHLAQSKAAGQALSFSVSGFDVFHLEKLGNNIRMWSAGRVPADPRLAEQYEAVRGRYRHPLFRGQLLRNLLRNVSEDIPWYDGFDRLFQQHDRDLFVGAGPPDFRVDVRRKFNEEFAFATPRGR